MITISDTFYIDGKPLQIISGSIHYFRTVPEYWQDRLEKLVNMGCNTVETYIPWNYHEPEKGKFCWTGICDVEKFISLAEKLGLYIIIRPAPYICAEWEWGGLPYWLMKEDPKIKVRSMNPTFINAVADYYKALMPKLVPHQIDRGGKIILMQIENEYGYYGLSKKYLKTLANLMRSNGVTVPFVTSDGPWGGCLTRGSIKEALPTGNFGSKVEQQFGKMRKILGKNKPLMVMEFWCGWFDAWGEEHHTSNLEQNKKDLQDALKLGHVNFYMFEGGTNWGFMAGKNLKSREADITSYDYDAVLREDGQITPKYEAFQKIISAHRKFEQVPLSTKIEFKDYGKLEIQEKAGLFETLEKISSAIKSPNLQTMEALGQGYGYILYRKKCEKNVDAGDIAVSGARDRAQIFANGLFADVLVENKGRENFGASLNRQQKGIKKSFKVKGKKQSDFEIFNLPLDESQISRIDFDAGYTEGKPAFYKFTFNAETLADTYLHLDGWEKGVAFINGFNLGRFWAIGPQKSLYIPAPLMKKGENTIIVFETEGKTSSSVELKSERGW